MTPEERIAELTEALAAANQELESLAFSISHDLRAPVRQIAGFARLLQEAAGAGLDAENRRCLEQMAAAARRLDALINALLELSRTGRAPFVRADVELDDLVDDALSALAPELRGRRIEWRRDRLPRVRGDAALLREMFAILLANAIKFTRQSDPAVIEIGATQGGRGEQAVVHIRDNGVGFDPRYASRLFGAFQRLHRAEEFEGTGIGLANARRIVARHGGRIWAQAEAGRGATFYFSLPSADRAAAG